MNTKTFMDNFEYLAEAPGGMQKLRDMILQLAVRGKLLSHEPTESASDLVETMRKDRERKLKDGLIRASEAVAGAQGDGLPYRLPRCWRTVRIGEAMHLVNGKAFKPSDWADEGLPIVRIQNLNNPTAPFNYCNHQVADKFLVSNDDLLISWSGTPGTSFGAFVWQGGPAVLNQHIFRAELHGPAFQKPFLRIAINSQLDTMIAQAHGGVGLRHITKGKLERLCIPLPPWSEQRRIVAKVGELMALCDELEARQQERRQVHVRLNTAALERLTTASSPAEFAPAWHRVRDHFDLLYSSCENVAQLRQAILQLAVQGKLVSRNTSDEPVEHLVERIEAERLRDNKFTDGKADTSLGAADCSDLAYKVPDYWRLCRLGSILTFGPKNGTSPKPVEFRTKTRSLTLSATTRGVFDPQHVKYLDCEIPPDSPLWLRDGDILIQRSNSENYVGVSAVYRGPPNRFTYPDLMMKVRVIDVLNVEFIHMVLNCRASRDFWRTRATGTSGSMRKINQTTVRSLVIPLPPVEEQHRIVARFRQLSMLCDELDLSLSRTVFQSKGLSSSLVREMVEICS